MAKEQTQAVPVQESEKKPAVYFDEEHKTVVATAAITAKVMGVTPATLSNWVKDGCPKLAYGLYDVKAVVEYDLRKRGAQTGPAEEMDPEKMSLQEQKLMQEGRLKEAQAEAARMKIMVAKGDYLEREQVVNELKHFAVSLKRSLQGLGKQLSQDVAAQIGPEDARRFDQLITNTVDDALEELAVEGVYQFESD